MSDAKAASTEEHQKEAIPLDKLVGFEIQFARSTKGAELTYDEREYLLTSYLRFLSEQGTPYFSFPIQDSEEGVRQFVLGEPKRLEAQFKTFLPTLQEGITAEILDQSGVSTFESYIASRMHVVEKTLGELEALRKDNKSLTERLKTVEETAKTKTPPNKELTERLERQGIELREARRALMQEEGRTARLETQLEEDRERYASATRTAEKMAGLEVTLTTANTQLAQTRNDYQQLNAQNTELQQQLFTITQQLKDAQSQTLTPEEKKELILLRKQFEKLKASLGTVFETPHIELLESSNSEGSATKTPALIESPKGFGVWLYTSIEKSQYEHIRNFLIANAKRLSVGELYAIATHGFNDQEQIIRLSDSLTRSGIESATPENLNSASKILIPPMLPLNPAESDMDWESLIKYRIVERLGFATLGEFARETKTYSSEAAIYTLLRKPCQREASYRRLSESTFIRLEDLKELSPRRVI